MILLITLLGFLGVWVIVRLWFPRARFYIYDYSGIRRKRFPVGYVKHDGTIIDTSDETGRRRVGQVRVEKGLGYVRIFEPDAPNGYLETGYVNPEGAIFALSDTTSPIAEALPEGNRKWWELWLRRHTDVCVNDDEPYGCSIEYVRFSGRQPNRPTLLLRGAAALYLYYRDRPNPDDPSHRSPIGFWDLALFSSLVYVAAYFLEGYFTLVQTLAGYEHLVFPFLGPELSYIVSLFVLYLVIWAAAAWGRFWWESHSPKPGQFLEMLNRSTGLSRWNSFLIAFLLIGIIWSIFVSGYRVLPLFVVMLFGLLLSRKAGGAAWVVQPRTRSRNIPPAGSEGGSTSTGEEAREYSWDVQTQLQKLDFNIIVRFDKAEISELRQRNPFNVNLGHAVQNANTVSRQLVMEGETAAQLQEVAKYIMRHNLTRIDEIQAALGFVQDGNITYIVDQDCDEIGKQEYFRFPAETMFDKRGDCDCKSVLAAALIRSLGYPVILLLSLKEEHAAIAVGGFRREDAPEGFAKEYKGGHYFFCETTGHGWEVGATSDVALRMLADPDAPVDLTTDLPQVYQ